MLHASQERGLLRAAITRVLGLLLVPGLSLLLFACDKFPENAGITLTDDNQPALVYQHCEGEQIESIAILEYDGSGDGDENYQEIAQIIPDDPSATVIPLSRAVVGSELTSEYGYRVIVETNQVSALTFFRPQELRHGIVEWNRKQFTIDEFQHRSSIC